MTLLTSAHSMNAQTKSGSSTFGNKIGFMISDEGFAIVALAKILRLAGVFSYTMIR